MSLLAAGPGTLPVPLDQESWSSRYHRAVSALSPAWNKAKFAVTSVLPARGTHFHADACERLKEAYRSRIGGQDDNLKLIADAICRHIQATGRQRPLVILTSGPPGVGKSWTARVTAQALLSHEPLLPSSCEPEEAPCRALLQLSAYSFHAPERLERREPLRDRIRQHVNKMPESIFVVEDYDRLDCSLRDMLRDVRR